MKKAICLFTFCLIAAFALSSTFAADEPKEKTETGTIMVVKDANGTPTEIMLHTMLMQYYIVLDQKGMELASMDGKKVKVTGIIEKRGDKDWIAVTSYMEESEKK